MSCLGNVCFITTGVLYTANTAESLELVEFMGPFHGCAVHGDAVKSGLCEPRASRHHCPLVNQITKSQGFFLVLLRGEASAAVEISSELDGNKT